jgi:hypothetical protein
MNKFERKINTKRKQRLQQFNQFLEYQRIHLRNRNVPEETINYILEFMLKELINPI